MSKIMNWWKPLKKRYKLLVIFSLVLALDWITPMHSYLRQHDFGAPIAHENHQLQQDLQHAASVTAPKP